MNGKSSQVTMRGGDKWEEIDINNFPTDFQVNDVLLVVTRGYFATTSPVDWNTAPTNIVPRLTNNNLVFMTKIQDDNYVCQIPIATQSSSARIEMVTLANTPRAIDLNERLVKFTLTFISFNGGGIVEGNGNLTTSDILQMWRLRPS